MEALAPILIPCLGSKAENFASGVKKQLAKGIVGSNATSIEAMKFCNRSNEEKHLLEEIFGTTCIPITKQ